MIFCPPIVRCSPHKYVDIRLSSPGLSWAGRQGADEDNKATHILLCLGCPESGVRAELPCCGAVSSVLESYRVTCPGCQYY